MSAAEILEQLPNLNQEDLDAVCKRAMELQHPGLIFESSPELLAAIDEADASFEAEGGVSVTEARRIMDSWNTK